MKKFDTPRMERIDLVRQNIMAASACSAQYCDGFTCPVCEDHDNCSVQTPCEGYNCPHYLCPEYLG